MDNSFVYGGNGMKNDFGGHDNYHLNNIYAYVGRAVSLYDAPMLNGHEDHFSNNKVIMTGNDVGSIICTGHVTMRTSFEDGHLLLIMPTVVASVALLAGFSEKKKK